MVDSTVEDASPSAVQMGVKSAEGELPDDQLPDLEQPPLHDTKEFTPPTARKEQSPEAVASSPDVQLPEFTPPTARRELARCRSAPATAPSSESLFWKGETAKLALGNVNYWLDGPQDPDAPLLVCLHGLNASMATFEVLLPLLWQQGVRTLAFDLYGFGLSAAPRRRNLSTETYVEQLKDLLDAVVPEVQKVCLLGFSMGGLIAADFARCYPERVDRILFVAPGGFLQKDQTPFRCFVFNCLRGPAGCCCVSFLGCLARCFSCCTRKRILGSRRALEFIEPDMRKPEDFEEITKKNLHRMVSNLSRTTKSYLGAIRHMPLWADKGAKLYSELASGPIPVLFLWGDEDCTIPWWEVRDMVTEIFAPRGTSCVFFREAGHGLLVEDAAQLAPYMAAWVRDSQEPEWRHILERCRLSAHEKPQAAGVVTSELNGNSV
mmetsp:Transcript_46256/g.83612  ORF Transcript_46256/g.83612 Transcript_46256/m.83612 type:complete len:435 (-) Transcript_46256:43-1347(-)